MATAEFLPIARKDLLGIAADIAAGSGSIEVAERFIDRIYARCNLQASRPLIGELRPELGSDVRQCLVGLYLVFYRPVEEGIEVLRVLHGNRDIARAWRTQELE